MSIRLSMLAGILIFALGGCASSTIGRDFSFDTLRTFKVGQTTKSEVLGIMGEPYGRYPAKAEVESWLYMYTDTRASNFYVGSTITQQGKSATLLFKGDLLTDLHWEEKYQRTEAQAFGGARSGRNVSDSDLATLKKGATTPQDVMVRFGRPSERLYRQDGSERWTYAYGGSKGQSRAVVLDFEHGVLTGTGSGGSSSDK